MKKWAQTYRLVGDALQLGASIVFATLIGAAFGYWLDGKFGTFPILSIVFFLLGVAAAARNVWIVVKREFKVQAKDAKRKDRSDSTK